MKTLVRSSILSILLLCFVATQLSLVTSISPDYDFFLFVQRWPGAECQGTNGCCFSSTSKPAIAFGIHGLWPQYDDGSGGFPTRCDPNNRNPFNLDLIKNLEASLETNWPSASCPLKESKISWEHQWVKHGTCSLSTLTQYQYFDAALKLKAQKNLLQILRDARIEPNGNSYKLGDIQTALIDGIGFVPAIECNDDRTDRRIKQLYEVSICVDKSGTKFMDCPFYPRPKNCDTQNKMIKFAKFGPIRSELSIADE